MAKIATFEHVAASGTAFDACYLADILAAAGIEGERPLVINTTKDGKHGGRQVVLLRRREAVATQADADTVARAKQWAEAIAKGWGSLDQLDGHPGLQKMVATLLKPAAPQAPKAPAAPMAPVAPLKPKMGRPVGSGLRRKAG